MSKVMWLHVNDVAHEAPKTTSWKMQKYVGCGSELRAPAWDVLPYGEPSCGWGNSMLGRTHKETHTYKPEKKHCCAAGDNLA